MFIKNKEIMNKSAVLVEIILSKRFGPGPSSVELPVRWNRFKVYIRHKLEIKIKGFVVHARPSNQSVVDWVTSHVEMFSNRKPRQVLFNAPKVFAKTLS